MRQKTNWSMVKRLKISRDKNGVRQSVQGHTIPKAPAGGLRVWINVSPRMNVVPPCFTTLMKTGAE